MSQQEGVEADEVADRVARDTIPGYNNTDIVVEVAESAQVVHNSVVEDLNNWVEIVEVKYHGDKVVGIPCRYRWTIKRWVSHDMDEWLLSNGWTHIPHLKADSREHEPNELEARYAKDYGGWTVYVNIWVPFTEDVFDVLNEGGDLEEFKSADERFEEKMAFLDERRD